MKRLAATVLALLTGLALGCATDPRMPPARASRPLVAAPDTGIVTASAGLRLTNPAPAFGFDFEIGLTDRLALVLPAVLQYGGELDESWSLAVLGGLTSATVGNDLLLTDTPADPRQPSPGVYPSGLGFGAGPHVQWRPRPDVRLRLKSVASAFFYGVDHVSLHLGSDLQVVKSFSRWVSVAASIGHLMRGAPSRFGEVYEHRAGVSGTVQLHFGGFDVGVIATGDLAPDLGSPTLQLMYAYLF